MLETIDILDKQLFVLLNGMHEPWLDPIMAWITGKREWFPFYGLLLVWIFWKHRWRGAWALLGVALTIVCADFFASGICKPFFERLRPSHEPSLSTLVHIVGSPGGKYGFISSHAANTFGLAMFLSLLGGKEARWLRLLFFWAAVVSYSRIYVGVHYPADIMVGGLTGVLWGWLVFQFYLWGWPRVYRLFAKQEN